MIRIQSKHEKVFQEWLIRSLEQRGFVARHWEPEISSPDLWVFKSDRYVLAELKSVEKLTKRAFGSLFEEGQLPWIATHIQKGMNVIALIEVRETNSVIVFNPFGAQEVEKSFDRTVKQMSEIYPYWGRESMVEGVFR